MLLASGGEVIRLAATPNWISESDPGRVGLWLAHRGLTNGVGDYWSAAIVTALTDKEVRVSPVVASNDRLVPSLWLADVHWYDGQTQFVIWRDGNNAGVSLEAIKATYGGRLGRVGRG